MAKMSRKEHERRYFKAVKEALAKLGEAVICDRCGATCQQLPKKCTAPLDDPCPGFLAYGKAKDAALVRNGL